MSKTESQCLGEARQFVSTRLYQTLTYQPQGIIIIYFLIFRASNIRRQDTATGAWTSVQTGAEKHRAIPQLLSDTSHSPCWRHAQHGKDNIKMVSSVSIVWLQTGRPGFDPRQRRKEFSSGLCAQTSSEAHPASFTMGTWWGGVLSRG
jgi:hypothetical protein